MDKNRVDQFFDKWHERYNDLMSLPLYIMYKNFSSNYSYTSSRDDLCSHFIQESTPDFGEFRKVCRTVEETLNNLDSEIYNELDKCKPIEYLSYFIYDKIKNIPTSNKFETFYETLPSLLISYEKVMNCNIIKFDTNKDEFYKKYELYFRSEIIHWIKLKYETYFHLDKDFCKKYLKECFQFYNQNIKDNYCKKFEHYNEELTKFSNNFNETLKFLKEKEIDITEEEIHIDHKTGCPSDERKDSVEEQVLNQAQPGQQMVHVSDNPNPESVSIRSPNADTNITAGTVSGTLIGISLLSLLFWKFTPLGSSIQHKIWDKGSNYNLEHQNDEVILDTSNNEDIYSYDNKYNIQYHSV
ncbi:PIR Superfamily Protein [Plasmodium ovale wallikeri]|uniref:PIR Superfamily Protein n=1 Tax=Plasmodium ovale wallikeri TaxID=864142 RepID=A0A1A9AFJ0_PLAOA|nr:PIR Superfamily Protein [Plasmodium ovale wallikeri]SBT59199.1 PIR Superfamily Protein [Plasmodium ovale wallikeri]